MSNTIENLGEYKVTIKSVNGIEINCTTNDLLKSISEYRPQFIKGLVSVKVTKGNRIFDRNIFVPQARRLFYNGFALKLFVRNIERALL